VADDYDNGSAKVSETDAILPAQFWAGGGDGAHPERRLMAAVLEDAVALRARARASTDRQVIQDAAAAGEWMASDDRSGPFSFASICDVLGLDVEGVRAAVRDMRRGKTGFVRPRDSSGRGRHQIQQKRPRSRAA
jgi:hypothetical protein